VPKVRKVEQKQGRFHHGNLRQALIDGALQILGKEGAQAITLREVARRAGVTHAAPYRHFEGKEALLAAVAEEGFRVLRTEMEESMRARSGDPLEQLTEFGVAYIRFALKNPAHYRLMYGPEFANRSAHPALQEASRAAFVLLLEVMRLCQAAKVIREGDPVQLALTSWSLVHGLSLLIMDRQLEDAGVGRTQADMAVRMATQMLRDGIVLKKTKPENNRP
jgi:AcrR family transcriptional regulator